MAFLGSLRAKENCQLWDILTIQPSDLDFMPEKLFSIKAKEWATRHCIRGAELLYMSNTFINLGL